MSRLLKILSCGVRGSNSDEHLEAENLPEKESVAVTSSTKTPNGHTTVTAVVSNSNLESSGSTIPVPKPNPSPIHGDLWDEAYKKLQIDQPKLFEKYKSCVLDDDDDGADQTESVDFAHLEADGREKYLAAQIEGKVRTIHKEEWSGAAKVYQKTVQAVLFAKGFIAQAASNEPHAALAWAGVSMLLPVSGGCGSA